MAGVRDRARWSVGGLAVTTMLACTLAMLVLAVQRFRAAGVTELSVALAMCAVLSFAMALIMRQGGIAAEDADYAEAGMRTRLNATPSTFRPHLEHVLWDELG